MTTLRARLFMATAAAVVLSVGISLLIGGLIVRHAVRNSIITNLGRQAETLAQRVELVAPRTPPVVNRGRSASGARIAFLPLASAGTLLPSSAVSALNAGRGTQGDARGFLYAARPVNGNALVVFRSDRLQGRDWRPFLDAFLIAGVVGAALAALVSFLLARAIGAPVARVARASRELAGGGAPAAVPVEGPEELASLASAFNEMQAQLAAARDRERSFLLSVSHELKTPLTAIRGYVEALADGAVPVEEGSGTIGREAARLERLVRDLLDLARLDQRSFEVRREAIELSAAAREAVGRYERQAQEFGVTLEGPAPGVDSAPAVADADRVVQVVSNLVENALRVTPAGGHVSVSAQPGAIVVQDDGPGLEAADLPRAFERFYLHRRLGDERPVGSGLGLAIVKELTEAMGGGVSVTSEPGTGTQFVVRLPRA